MKNIHSDTSFLSMSEYERIRKNAKAPSKQDEKNEIKVLEQQKETKQAKAKAFRERLVEIDKVRLGKVELSDIDKENIELTNNWLAQAQKILENNESCVKEMGQIVLNAKIAAIRDKQLQEHKAMEQVYKRKEEKQDLIMELNRWKEWKLQEERDLSVKKQQRNGALVIIKQIQERELDRKREREMINKEGQEMWKEWKQRELDEIRILEERKAHAAKMALEIAEGNKAFLGNRERRKNEERELDLRIMKYNLEKAKKEELELAEKKRIQVERERETQKLRELQEKAQDKRSELDGLRAKRAFEEQERKTREKEMLEIIQRNKQFADLMISNEKQKVDKEFKLAQMAKNEQEEYQKITKAQLENLENEKRVEEERKKKRYEHNENWRKQIKVKEEIQRIEQRKVLEEGRSIRQKLDQWKIRMEKVKQEKLEELKSWDVDPKYIDKLKKFKIKG